jgi:hypothetical protein
MAPFIRRAIMPHLSGLDVTGEAYRKARATTAWGTLPAVDGSRGTGRDPKR